MWRLAFALLCGLMTSSADAQEAGRPVQTVKRPSPPAMNFDGTVEETSATTRPSPNIVCWFRSGTGPGRLNMNPIIKVKTDLYEEFRSDASDLL